MQDFVHVWHEWLRAVLFGTSFLLILELITYSTIQQEVLPFQIFANYYAKVCNTLHGYVEYDPAVSGLALHMILDSVLALNMTKDHYTTSIRIDPLL